MWAPSSLYFFNPPTPVRAGQTRKLNLMDINELESPAGSTKALFERLQQLKRDCAPTSTEEELAIVLIKACIFEGLDAGSRIVGMLTALRLNKKYAGMMLAKWRGNDPQRHHWQRSAEGRYAVHDEALSPPLHP